MSVYTTLTSRNTSDHSLQVIQYPARNFLLHVESAPPSTSNTCAHTKRYSSTLCDSSLIAVLALVFSCSKSLPQLNLYLWENFKRGQSSHLTVSLVIDVIVSCYMGEFYVRSKFSRKIPLQCSCSCYLHGTILNHFVHC